MLPCFPLFVACHMSKLPGDPSRQRGQRCLWDIAVPDWDIADVMLLSLLTSQGGWLKALVRSEFVGWKPSAGGGTHGGVLHGAALWDIAVPD